MKDQMLGSMDRGPRAKSGHSTSAVLCICSFVSARGNFCKIVGLHSSRERAGLHFNRQSRCGVAYASAQQKCCNDALIDRTETHGSQTYLALFQATTGVQIGKNLPLAQAELLSLLLSGRRKDEPVPSLLPTPSVSPPESDRPRLWFVHCSKTQEELAAIAYRSVLLRGMYHVIANGTTIDEAVQDFSASRWRCDEYHRDMTWRFERRGVNGPCTLPRNQFEAGFLPGLAARFGKVDLSGQPDVEVEALEDQDTTYPAATPVVTSVRHIWLAELVGGRYEELFKKFPRESFSYLTQAHMQPDLALLLVNLAGVAAGTAVLDPFCGSCSILLLAAWVGAKAYDAIVTDLPQGRKESLKGRTLEEVLVGTLALAKDVLQPGGRIALLAHPKTKRICEEISNSGLRLVCAAKVSVHRYLAVAEKPSQS